MLSFLVNNQLEHHGQRNEKKGPLNNPTIQYESLQDRGRARGSIAAAAAAAALPSSNLDFECSALRPHLMTEEFPQYMYM